MFYKLCICLSLCSGFLFAGDKKDQRGYAVFVDKDRLLELPSKNVFSEVVGSSFSSLDMLIKKIKYIGRSTKSEGMFCIINSGCYTDSMTRINNIDIVGSLDDIKCITGMWMSLPAWIIMLYELTMLDIYETDNIDPLYRDLLYTHLLKDAGSNAVNEAAVEDLVSIIDFLGRNTQNYTYNKKSCIVDFGDNLKSNDPDQGFKKYLCKSPFENEDYNHYLVALQSERKNSSSDYDSDSEQTKLMTVYGSNEDQNECKDAQNKECENLNGEDGMHGSNEDKIIIKSDSYIKFVKLLQSLSEFTHNTSNNGDLPAPYCGKEPYFWLDEKEVIVSTELSYEERKEYKTIDLSNKLIDEDRSFFKRTDYDKGVLFLFGDFSKNYHQDVMIDHVDMAILFDTKNLWLYELLQYSPYSIKFFMDRCAHYDSVRVAAFRRMESLSVSPINMDSTTGNHIICNMLLDSLFLPQNRITVNVNKNLYGIMRNCMAFPNEYKGVRNKFSFENMWSRLLAGYTVTTNKTLRKFKRRKKTYDLTLLLLQQSIKKMIKNDMFYIEISKVMYSNGRKHIDLTPHTIDDFSVLWGESIDDGTTPEFEKLKFEMQCSISSGIVVDEIESLDSKISHLSVKDNRWGNQYDKIRKDAYVWKYCKHLKLLNIDNMCSGSLVCSGMHARLSTTFAGQVYNMMYFNYLPNIEFYKSDVDIIEGEPYEQPVPKKHNWLMPAVGRGGLPFDLPLIKHSNRPAGRNYQGTPKSHTQRSSKKSSGTNILNNHLIK